MIQEPRKTVFFKSSQLCYQMPTQSFQCFSCALSSYLVKDVNLVVGQVQGDHAAQAPESTLLHLHNVAALQVEVSEVRREDEHPRGQHLQVVIPQVQFHCNL